MSQDYLTVVEALRINNNKLLAWEAQNKLATDASLTITGAAADAAAVGEMLVSLDARLDNLINEISMISKFVSSISLAEKGSTVNAIEFSWRYNKIPIRQYLNDIEIDVDLIQYTLTDLNLTENAEFTLTVIDEQETSISRTLPLEFVNGVYFGLTTGGTSFNNATILGLSRKLQKTREISFSVEAKANQYITFALPTAYGEPTFSVGGFEGGFNQVSTFQFTNASGYTESYNVWVSDNANLGKTVVKVT